MDLLEVGHDVVWYLVLVGRIDQDVVVVGDSCEGQGGGVW